MNAFFVYLLCAFLVNANAFKVEDDGSKVADDQAGVLNKIFDALKRFLGINANAVVKEVDSVDISSEKIEFTQTSSTVFNSNEAEKEPMDSNEEQQQPPVQSRVF